MLAYFYIRISIFQYITISISVYQYEYISMSVYFSSMYMFTYQCTSMCKCIYVSVECFLDFVPKGSVELVDVSACLTELKRAPGVKTWKVCSFSTNLCPLQLATKDGLYLIHNLIVLR